MSRNQSIISISLAIIAVVFLLINEPTDLRIATKLSPVLLFPVRVVTNYFQFLSVSRARINVLEIQVSKLELENTDLRKHLVLDSISATPISYQLRRVQVVGRDPNDFNGFIYINMGRKDSLYTNQPVVITDKLVGKIKNVGDYYSIVETIENRNIAISAVDGRTGVNGIVRYRDYLIFDFIKIADDINVGDSIYTSGMSESFPPGILIGTVESIHQTEDLLFKNVRLKPTVQINHLYYVYVLFGGEATNIPDQVRMNPGG